MTSGPSIDPVGTEDVEVRRSRRRRRTVSAYRDGDREHALMSQQAVDLSDQQIADLAAYFAAQPSQLRDLRGAHDN